MEKKQVKVTAKKRSTEANPAHSGARRAAVRVARKVSPSDDALLDGGAGAIELADDKITVISDRGDKMVSGGANNHSGGEKSHACGVNISTDGVNLHASGAESHSDGENAHESGVTTPSNGGKASASGAESHSDGENAHKSGDNVPSNGVNGSSGGAAAHILQDVSTPAGSGGTLEYTHTSDKKEAEALPEVTYALTRGEVIDGSFSATETSPPKKPSSKKARRKAKAEKRRQAEANKSPKNSAAGSKTGNNTTADSPTAAAPTGGFNHATWAAAQPSADTVGVTATATRERPKLQKWREMSAVRIIVMLLSLALMIFSLSPLMVGVITPGIVPPFMIGLFFYVLARIWNVIRFGESRLLDMFYGTVAALVCAGIVMMAFISGQMLSAAMKTAPDDGKPCTVVVLGCKINGTQPSRMLTDRLNSALDYLLEHPEAYCVVTGGQGDDEPCAEAEVMRDYLVAHGISEWRIVAETQSTSTRENMENVIGMMDEYNLHGRLLIATDRFHQYRAHRIAAEYDVECYSLPNGTRWYLAMQYWFREMAAIVRMHLGLD